MKIRFSKLMTLVAVLFGGMLASCAPEEITRVPAKMSLSNADEFGASALVFSNRAETKDFSFTADGDWYIRIPKECDWLTVTPASGTGDATVKFSTKLYEAEKARTAAVAFVCDNIEQKGVLNVTQLQKFFLETNLASTVVSKTGGNVYIDVTTNGTYTCTIDATGASWLSVAETAKNQVTLSAKPISEGALKNYATVTVTCVEDESLSQVFNLSQKNLQLALDAKEILSNGHAAAGELAVNIINVENWSLTSSAPWLTVEKTAAGKVAFSMTENLTYADREATITVQCLDSEEDADVMSVVKVKQLVAADIVDFVFDETGIAHDASVNQLPIESNVGDATMNMLQTHALWGPTVLHGQNNTITSGFWKCVYYESGGVDFRPNLENGYTMEAIFSIPTAHVNKETKAFGATGSGGFAIMLGNTSTTNGSKETIQFIQHDNTSSPLWRMAATDIKPVPGQIYHVFGVWDPQAQEVRCYVDGVLSATKSCVKLQHMNTTKKVFTVCGNHTNSGTNGSWNGSVYAARVYDGILTEEQIMSKTEMKVNFQIVK